MFEPSNFGGVKVTGIVREVDDGGAHDALKLFDSFRCRSSKISLDLVAIASFEARRVESRCRVPDRRPGVFEHSKHSVCLS